MKFTNSNNTVNQIVHEDDEEDGKENQAVNNILKKRK